MLTMSRLCGAGDLIQGFTQARQAVCQLRYNPFSSYNWPQKQPGNFYLNHDACIQIFISDSPSGELVWKTGFLNSNLGSGQCMTRENANYLFE